MMSTLRDTSPDLLSTLLVLSGDAEAAGNYETAYHLLMGALHDADYRGDIGGVERVADFARKQEARLEAIDPPHHLSSTSAKGRGTPALYQSFQVHAAAVRARLRNAAAGGHIP
jgi:hypothetical protein